MRIILTGGQRNDITQAAALLAGLQSRYVLADKGYDSREFVEHLRAQLRACDSPTHLPTAPFLRQDPLSLAQSN